MRCPSLLVATLVTACAASAAQVQPVIPTTPQQFLDAWGSAWEAHNVDAMVRLYADDGVNVNRFGVISHGRDELRRTLGWLHQGPFKTSHFATPRLLDQRRVGSVTIMHAAWKNPSGRAGSAEDDLILTIVLKDLGTDGLEAEEVNTVTVEPIAPAL